MMYGIIHSHAVCIDMDIDRYVLLKRRYTSGRTVVQYMDDRQSTHLLMINDLLKRLEKSVDFQ